MLTADLVNVRIVKGAVLPRYVDADDPDMRGLASQLVDAFSAAVGERRGDLDARLDDILGTGTSFMLHRGLAKLLSDRCRFETDAPLPPEALREAVLTRAAEVWRAVDGAFDRDQVLNDAATALALEAGEVEAGLFADLKSEQVLAEADLPSPEVLLQRYNTALAQGVLLRARELEITVAGLSPRDAEALFRQVRFHQLMHRIEPTDRADGSGWRIVLDGPISALRSSGRYGIQMARFLPTLLHFSGWTLEARLAWGKRRLRKVFTLSEADGLRPHTKLTGRWLPDEVAALHQRITETSDDWTARAGDTLVDLGGEGVLVPDLVLEHDNGRIAYVEIFGFWNKGAVKRRLRLLKRHGPPNVVVAVLGSLASGATDELDDLPGRALVFKRTVLPKKLLAAADGVAR